MHKKPSCPVCGFTHKPLGERETPTERAKSDYCARLEQQNEIANDEARDAAAHEHEFAFYDND
jgi:hypothetical protein